MTDICYSGGAVGADTEWGLAAEAAGHQVFHVTFKGHKGANKPNAYVVDETRLEEADAMLKFVNGNILKRAWPPHSDFVKKLLERNYFQVVDTERVYAVAGINEDGLVIGGTAWAVECFKQLHPDSDEVYVFDSWKDQWFQWNFMGWREIDQPPKPHGKYTAIGSRELDELGKTVIWEMYE